MMAARGAGDGRGGFPELPREVRAALAEIQHELGPFAHRITDVVARTSPLRTVAARMSPRPNPLPLGPRVIWDVAPPAPDYSGRHNLLWQLVMKPPARRPQNLRPHEPGTPWQYDSVDDVVHLVEDLRAVVTAQDASLRLTAARAVVNRHPWWVSPWFAKPRIRRAIRRLVDVATPEALALGCPAAAHVRAWILDDVLPRAVVDALAQTEDLHAVARLAKRLAGARILAAEPRTHDEDVPALATIDEAAERERAVLELLLAVPGAGAGEDDALAALHPDDRERVEQLHDSGAVDLTTALAMRPDLVRLSERERAVAEHLVRDISAPESARLLELTVRQVYDARAHALAKVRRLLGRRA